MDYRDVQDELSAYGFTNIAVLPKKDLRKGWLIKDGAVDQISINGRTDFKEKSKFHADVHVVITYHTFKKPKLTVKQDAVFSNEEKPIAHYSDYEVEIEADAKSRLECEMRTDSRCEPAKQPKQTEGIHMTYCSSCGAQIADNTKFCPECGSPNTPDTTNSDERQQEFKGKIIKCPNCGETLKSFEGICPACGHEISAAKMSVSFKTFIENITACDAAIARSPVPPKQGFKAWSKRGKFWWIVLNIFTLCIPLAFYLIMPLLGFWGGAAFLPDEKRKAALIKNYAFPNDRESVLEILLHIKSQMAFIASEKIDRNAVHWASTWGHKAEQIYQKAEIIIKGDTISANIHSDIMQNWKRIKKSFGVRVGIALAFIAVLIVLWAVGGSPFNLLSKPSESISNLFVATEKTFEWPDTELSRLLPQPPSDKGEISSIDAESLMIQVDEISISQFETYITQCKEKGFSNDSEREGNIYSADSTDHFYLELQYTDYDSEMNIYLEAPKMVGALQWPSTALTSVIPDPKSGNGEITHNDEEKLWILVYDYSESKCESYLNEIEKYGFTIDSKTDSATYEAYNESGYHITIYDQSNRHDQSELSIVLEAPMKMEAIRWPDTKLVKQIPVPETDFGKIDNESGSSFTAYIGNTSPEEYADYVDACVDKGFTKGLYTREQTHFYGDNSADSTISVDYIGFNIMKIDIYNYDY